MMLTRLDWWVGVILIVAALLVVAAVPRYEYHTLSMNGSSVVWETTRLKGGPAPGYLESLTEQQRKEYEAAQQQVAALNAETSKPSAPTLATTQLQIDRWTGQVQIVRVKSGRWWAEQ